MNATTPPSLSRSGDKALRAVLYARVSTDTGDQDPESQFQALRPWCQRRGWTWTKEGEFADRVTGDPLRRKGDPPGLRAALRLLEQRQADVLVIFSADRLVRSPWELVQLVSRIQSLGGQVASYEDGSDLDTTTDHGEFALIMRGWFARMFLRLNRKATLAGLARARAAGKRLGRPPRPIDSGRLAELRAQQDEHGRPPGWRFIGRTLGVSHTHARMAWERLQRKNNPPQDQEPPSVGT